MKLNEPVIYRVNVNNTVDEIPEILEAGEEVTLPYSNYFYTLDKAAKFVDHRRIHDPITSLIIKVVSDNNWIPDWNDLEQPKYQAVYDYKNSRWYIIRRFTIRDTGAYYFSKKSSEDVLKALNKYFPKGYVEENPFYD